MQIKVNKNEFQESLSFISGTLGNDSLQPILNNGLLEVKDSISVSSTNSQASLRIKLSGEIKSTGDVVIPVVKILEVLRKISEKEIDLSVVDNFFVVKYGKSSTKFLCLPTTDYPQFPKLEGKEITISGKVLKSLLRKTIFAIAEEQLKYTLNGIHLLLEGRKIEAVGTNGQRLAIASGEATSGSKKDRITCILPKKICNEIIKNITDDEVKVLVSDRAIAFYQKNIVLHSSLIAGEFPDYRKVIPEKTNSNITLDKSELSKVVSISEILTRETSDGMKWQIKDKQLNVITRTSEVGESFNTIPIVEANDIKDIELRLAPDYINDVFSRLDGDKVTIVINENNTPIMVIEDNFKYIVSPLSI